MHRLPLQVSQIQHPMHQILYRKQHRQCLVHSRHGVVRPTASTQSKPVLARFIFYNTNDPKSYCRIPAAILIFFGIVILISIIGCCCGWCSCMAGCCRCCGCCSSSNSRRRMRNNRDWKDEEEAFYPLPPRSTVYRPPPAMVHRPSSNASSTLPVMPSVHDYQSASKQPQQYYDKKNQVDWRQQEGVV